MAVVLTAIVGLVYAPAVVRPFAADQLQYFAELRTHTLAEGLRYLDYGHWRYFFRGDDALFRPGVMAWLALGTSWYSYHHVAWNVATLGVHVLTSTLFYRMLLAIQPGRAAAACAALFAVMAPGAEAVLWQHNTGQWLGFGLLLIALRAAITISRSTDAAADHHYLTVTIALLPAVFFNEALGVMALVVALWLVWADARWSERPRRMTLATFAPALIFVAAFAMHALRATRFMAAVNVEGEVSLFRLGHLITVAPNAIEGVVRWSVKHLLPTVFEYWPIPYERFGTRAVPASTVLRSINVIAAIAVFAAVMTSLRTLRTHRATIVLMGALMFVYAMALRLGRTAGEVGGVPYYLYPAGLCLLAMAYAAYEAAPLTSPARRWWRVSLIGMLVVHSAASVRVAANIAATHAEHSAYVSTLEVFVDAHQRESSFSFVVVNPPDTLDPVIEMRPGYFDSGQPIVARRMSSLIFRPWYDDAHPIYALSGPALAQGRIELVR